MASLPITLMLQEFAAGDKSALDQLTPHVYEELRRLAGRHLKNERSGHTLQPTALVHEAYVRLIGNDQPDYRSRAHFLSVAARLMRQILIDHARTRNAEKRGGGQLSCSLEDWMDSPVESPPEVIAVDDALRTLEQSDPGKAKLIEMRFFGGLTAEESADVLGVPVQKVRAELRVAQAWLKRDLDRRRIGPK
ncbi:MAG: sigma-70 family RNA polymerase sigma factor [Bryobacteraceae bacterium]